MKVGTLREIIINDKRNENKNTNCRKIFKLEEGHEMKREKNKAPKRKWINEAQNNAIDISQKQHALIWLEDKEKDKEVSGMNLQNPALIVYLRELIVKKEEKDGEKNKINTLTDEIIDLYKVKKLENEHYKINEKNEITQAKKEWQGLPKEKDYLENKNGYTLYL